MDRRGFLGSILALGAAPAIVKSESLMKLWTPPQAIVTVSAGNTIITVEMITKEALEILGNFAWRTAEVWGPARNHADTLNIHLKRWNKYEVSAH